MNKNSTDYSFLNKCSKEELIFFIKQAGWFRQTFYYTDVLSRRWKIKSDQLAAKQKRHHENFKSLDLEYRGRLAGKFNNESDIKKKLSILEEMEGYEKKFNQWVEAGKRLRREEKKVDKLYAELNREYDKRQN